MALYRCMKCPSHHIIEEMVDVVSDDLLHDSHAVQVFFNRIFLHLRTKTENITKAFILTDGCASQYKCKTVFMDATLSKKDYGLIVERGYYGSGHGKNRCDGEGGILKTRVSRAIRNDNAVVNNAVDFYQLCKEALEMPEQCLNGNATKRRTILWISKEDISHNRPNREVKTVNGTREIHSLRGEEGGIVHTRYLSCFCKQCLNGADQCENSCYVKKWKKVELKPVNPIDTIENTGVDLLDRSNLDVSFDPEQPAEFNASFCERLMGALDDEVIEPAKSDGKQDDDLLKFACGTYVRLKHGTDAMPAVIPSEQPLSASYFEKFNRNSYIHDDADTSDILSIIKSPELQLCGSRLFYKFTS